MPVAIPFALYFCLINCVRNSQLGAKEMRRGKRIFLVFFSSLATCRLCIYNAQVVRGYAPGSLQKIKIFYFGINMKHTSLTSTYHNNT